MESIYGIIINIAFFFLGLMVARYYSSRYTLEFEELKSRQIPNLEPYGLSVELDNIKIKGQLFNYEFQIINRGNREITSGLHDEDILIRPKADYRILKLASIIKSNDKNGTVSYTEDDITIKILSLKKNESIIINALIEFEGEISELKKGENEEYKMSMLQVNSGRYNNVNKIGSHNRPPQNRIPIAIIIIFGILGLGFYICSAVWETFDILIIEKLNLKGFLMKYYGLMFGILIVGLPMLVKWAVVKIFR